MLPKPLSSSPVRRGRPATEHPAEVVYFRCPPHLVGVLDRLARASGRTRSRYIADVLLEVTGTQQPLVTKVEGETP